MAEPCDCLNDCGDDRRVHEYLVEPCAGRMREKLAKKQRLQEELQRQLDAKAWRQLPEALRRLEVVAVQRRPGCTVGRGDSLVRLADVLRLTDATSRAPD
ncbi:hypothetical protein PH586_09135 [Pseudomonas sp. SA3-5]|uniref:Uncharacterized protein n=1 Tax=Pseudomonas aestuarii TaxID=3018340 RepID=A0ABT4XEA7_9PSED|nr:hypothetical protein [Pseudomonas aestuarii]MDA7086541.1 hypothetical protein [Pseudomonas aestuarii]